MCLGERLNFDLNAKATLLAALLLTVLLVPFLLDLKIYPLGQQFV